MRCLSISMRACRRAYSAQVRAEAVLLVDAVHVQLGHEVLVHLHARLPASILGALVLLLGLLRLLLPDLALERPLRSVLALPDCLEADLVREAVLHGLRALGLHARALLLRLLRLLLRRGERVHHALLVRALAVRGGVPDHLT